MVRRDGFTLIELLVVLAIILLLVGIIAPALTPVMELARRQKCAANLNKLVKDMRTYAIQNEQMYPSAYNDACTLSDGTAVGIVWNSNWVGGAGRLKDLILGVAPNKLLPDSAGPSRSLYLLARGKFTTLEAFICPSTDDLARPVDGMGKALADPLVDFDFYSGYQLSYSYQSHKNGGTDRYYPPSMGSDGPLIVLADRNPIIGEDSWTVDRTKWTAAATPTRRSGTDKYNQNSYSHGTNSTTGLNDGQNVAESSSTVRWTTTPNCSQRLWTDPANVAAGPVGDNIWTWGDPANGAPQTGGQAGVGSGLFHDASPTKSGDTFLH